MLPAVYTDTIHVSRRDDYATASRDSLNNPLFGNPSTWKYVYTNIKVRLAFSSKDIQFTDKGELIKPTGVMYYDAKYDLKPMDRVIVVNSNTTREGIEYVVLQVTKSVRLHGVVDHGECIVQLPI